MDCSPNVTNMVTDSGSILIIWVKIGYKWPYVNSIITLLWYIIMEQKINVSAAAQAAEMYQIAALIENNDVSILTLIPLHRVLHTTVGLTQT